MQSSYFQNRYPHNLDDISEGKLLNKIKMHFRINSLSLHSFFHCFQKHLKIISSINFTVPFPKLVPFFLHSQSLVIFTTFCFWSTQLKTQGCICSKCSDFLYEYEFSGTPTKTEKQFQILHPSHQLANFLHPFFCLAYKQFLFSWTM